MTFFGQFRQAHVETRIIDGEQHVGTAFLHETDERLAQPQDVRQFAQHFHEAHDAVVLDVEDHLATGLPQIVAAHAVHFGIRFDFQDGPADGAGMQIARRFPGGNHNSSHNPPIIISTKDNTK